MADRTGIEIKELARVLASGTIAYLVVHMFLLPFLAGLGVSFPTYFYLGVITTGVLSTIISLLTRPRRKSARETAGETGGERAEDAPALQPAE